MMVNYLWQFIKILAESCLKNHFKSNICLFIIMSHQMAFYPYFFYLITFLKE